MAEVNHEVVHRNNVFLPGELSVRGSNGFKSTCKIRASVAAMPQTSKTEKSAESIVVVSESVSSCVSMIRGQEYCQAMRSKSQTKEEEATGGDL